MPLGFGRQSGGAVLPFLVDSLGRLVVVTVGQTQVSATPEYIFGLKLSYVSTTQIDIGSGSAYIEGDASVLDVPNTISKSGLSMTASTWYHVYLYNNAGTPAVEIVTTAPASPYQGRARSKTGDATRRYLGSIYSDSASHVLPFEHNVDSGGVQYKLFNSASSPFRALSAGTASSATAVSLAGAIPVTAVLAYVRISSSADKNLFISEDTNVSATQATVALNVGNTAVQNAFMFIAMDASQQIWYKFQAALGAGNGNVDVLGYQFSR